MSDLLNVQNPDAGVFVGSDVAHWRRAWAGLGIDPAPGRVTARRARWGTTNRRTTMSDEFVFTFDAEPVETGFVPTVRIARSEQEVLS
jgi:hypothetical protein